MKKRLPSIETLVSLYRTMSMNQIAEKYGTTPSAVQCALRRAGVPKKPMSEAIKLAFALGRKTPVVIRGPDHYLWKGGVDRRPYRKVKEKEACETCRGRLNLGFHHKDFDHYNDAPENLQVLCLPCHMSLHKKAYWAAKRAGKIPPKSNGPLGWHR
jgi:hypothetical protein